MPSFRHASSKTLPKLEPPRTGIAFALNSISLGDAVDKRTTDGAVAGLELQTHSGGRQHLQWSNL